MDFGMLCTDWQLRQRWQLTHWVTHYTNDNKHVSSQCHSHTQIGASPFHSKSVHPQSKPQWFSLWQHIFTTTLRYPLKTWTLNVTVTPWSIFKHWNKGGRVWSIPKSIYSQSKTQSHNLWRYIRTTNFGCAPKMGPEENECLRLTIPHMYGIK